MIIEELVIEEPENELEFLMMCPGDPPPPPDWDHIEAVEEALQQLPARYRELLEYRFYDQLTYQAIADIRHWSKPYTFRQTQRALLELRHLLVRSRVINWRYNLFTDWATACKMVVDSYCRCPAAKQPINDDTLNQLAIDLKGAFGSSDPGRVYYAVAFEVVGELKRTHPEVLDGLVDLLVSKQHDYGHGNIQAFGHEGVIVRLSDKVARLRNLMTRDLGPVNESLIDTLLDMVGYAVIGEMLTNGTFMLPLDPIEEKVDGQQLPPPTIPAKKALEASK